MSFDVRGDLVEGLGLANFFCFLQQIVAGQGRQARAKSHSETAEGNQNPCDHNKSDTHGLAACLFGILLQNVGLQAEHFLLFVGFRMVVTQQVQQAVDGQHGKLCHHRVTGRLCLSGCH